MVQFWISSSTHNSAGLPALAVGFRKCPSYNPRTVVSSLLLVSSSNVFIGGVACLTLELLKPMVSSPPSSKHTVTSIHFRENGTSILTCTLETHKVCVLNFITSCSTNSLAVNVIPLSHGH
jgi:hypothetical protein